MKSIGRYVILADYKGEKRIMFGVTNTKAEAEKRIRIIKKNPKTKKLGYCNVRFKKL